MSSGYLQQEWQPTRWMAYLCDIKGKIVEPIRDFSFTAETTLNNIPTASVTVSGKRPGHFRPWLHSIAIVGDTKEATFFYGPIVNARVQLTNRAEYAATTELECRGWEEWLDNVYPVVNFQSEGEKTAWQAIDAIWRGGDQANAGIIGRANKYQVRPFFSDPSNRPGARGSIRAPEWGRDRGVPVWVDWNTIDSRAGAATAWGLYGDLHGQGIDVSHRPTWSESEQAFYSRCVIGGQTEPDTANWKNPKTGRYLGDREYIVGDGVSSITLEYRGDLQANAVLVSGDNDFFAQSPQRDGVDWDDPNVPNDSFAGLLLESQYPSETQAVDPVAVLQVQATSLRDRLRRTPMIASGLKIRFSPEDLHPGDIVVVTDNGGSQIINPNNADEIAVRSSMYGRINTIEVSSSDALFADLTLFQIGDPGAELTSHAMGVFAGPNIYEFFDATWGWTSRMAVARK